MAMFLLPLGGIKFTHAQYINIMYELDRHGRNSTFESVSHFCRIMRQAQSNVRQKCGSRFRGRIFVKFNSLTWIWHGRNGRMSRVLKSYLQALSGVLFRPRLPGSRDSTSLPEGPGNEVGREALYVLSILSMSIIHFRWAWKPRIIITEWTNIHRILFIQVKKLLANKSAAIFCPCHTVDLYLNLFFVLVINQN